MTDAKTVGVVACSAGGLEELRAGLVQPLIAAGRTVAVTLTPTAAEWLEQFGELSLLEDLTGLPVTSQPRLPTEPRRHPRIDAYIVAPASANTVAKLALGIADNQALTVLCENITTTPMLVFPRVNAAHARHPAWTSHLEHLSRAGVELLYGEDVWPPREPRSAGDRRALPWDHILRAADGLLG